MLSVKFIYYYAECHYAECRYPDCCGATNTSIDCFTQFYFHNNRKYLVKFIYLKNKSIIKTFLCSFVNICVI